MKNLDIRKPIISRVIAEDFKPDAPTRRTSIETTTDIIDGVTITPLPPLADGRGSLTELLTTRDGPIEPIVHVYWVTATPGSVRAWVYHRHQFDRLAFINGRFKIALYDMRPDSLTFDKLSVLDLGAERPSLLRIPPLVVHGVKNIGEGDASFVNMPTRAYDPKNPDKARLSTDDPRIPFRFDA